MAHPAYGVFSRIQPPRSASTTAYVELAAAAAWGELMMHDGAVTRKKNTPGEGDEEGRGGKESMATKQTSY